MRKQSRLALIVGSLVWVACSGDPQTVQPQCVSGITQACLCAPGVDGVQTCNATGAFDPCMCPEADQGIDACAPPFCSGPRDMGREDAAPTDLGADLSPVDAGLDAASDVSPDDAGRDSARPADAAADTTSDVSDARAADLPPDSSDTGSDFSTALCPVPLVTNPPFCDPVAQTGCPSGETCSLIVAGSPPTPRLYCAAAGPGALPEGGFCSSNSECSAGLNCVNLFSLDRTLTGGNICDGLCRLETGAGCRVDEVCTSTEMYPSLHGTGIGFCVPRCNPYVPSSCQNGTACALDWNYPDKACEPAFRCAVMSAPGQEGDFCGPDDIGRTACEKGFTCYETSANFFHCVKPCQTNAACGINRACGPPTGVAGLRYCQPVP